MPMLPLVADPASYRPCIQDLLRDGDRIRDYWLTLFERHLDTLAALPQADRRFEHHAAWPRFAAAYLAGLADLRRRPDLRGILTVLELTRYRDEMLAEFGFFDPFLDLKRRENRIAVDQYASVVRELDAMDPGSRDESLARGLFAGNLFDMGSKAAVDAFERGGGDFAAARSRVRPRPWAVDDFESWSRRRRYRQCLFFVDNCGPDIVLGVIPFVRELARGGTRIVLAANSKPALNDITAVELVELLDELRPLDPTLDRLVSKAHGESESACISVVASGCTSPLIDLSDVLPACCAAANESDLLVLEGMGRAIESNYDTRFSVDTLKVALIKDPMVAETIGVSLFDPVFRFEPVPS